MHLCMHRRGGAGVGLAALVVRNYKCTCVEGHRRGAGRAGHGACARGKQVCWLAAPRAPTQCSGLTELHTMLVTRPGIWENTAEREGGRERGWPRPISLPCVQMAEVSEREGGLSSSGSIAALSGG